MISTTDVAKTVFCPRMAINERHHQPGTILPARKDSFETLWQQWKQIQDLPEGEDDASNAQTLELLSQGIGGRHLRLVYKGVEATFPALLPLPSGGYHAIYAFASSYPKDTKLPLLRLNAWIAQKCGISISSHEIITLNKQYSRGETLDCDGLLVSHNRMKKARGGYYSITIDELMEQLEQDNPQEVEMWIDRAIELFASQHRPDPAKVHLCTAPRKCCWYEDCWNEAQLPDDALDFLSASRFKHEMKKEGIYSLKQALGTKLEGSPVQYAQIEAARSEHGEYIDRRALKSWFSTVQYPITYMDFEWDTYDIPPYQGMKPYDVLCFQYSLHIEEENGEIRHCNFFQDGDCRENFIRQLIEQVPPSGTVLVFNADGAERLRLRQLAQQFPQWKNELESICQRMMDLSVPFDAGSFYDIRQRGRFSLKTLLPLFSANVSYHHLQIQDGLQAVEAYRQLEREENSKNKEQIAKQISQYCAMDTQAEMELFHGLKKKVLGE